MNDNYISKWKDLDNEINIRILKRTSLREILLKEYDFGYIIILNVNKELQCSRHYDEKPIYLRQYIII